jgi:hypothetical protein
MQATGPMENKRHAPDAMRVSKQQAEERSDLPRGEMNPGPIMSILPSQQLGRDWSSAEELIVRSSD